MLRRNGKIIPLLNLLKGVKGVSPIAFVQGFEGRLIYELFIGGCINLKCLNLYIPEDMLTIVGYC